jgi:hypothetical protein
LSEQLASDRAAVSLLMAEDAVLIAAESSRSDTEARLRRWRASHTPSADFTAETAWLETAMASTPPEPADTDPVAIEAIRVRRESLASGIASAQARVLASEATLPIVAYGVLRERLTGLAAEYEEKRAAFEAIHARVFATARAIEMLARQVRGGDADGGAHSQLYLPRPRHPGFGASDDVRGTSTIERQAQRLIEELTEL